ncbi:MAG: hypothetical protein AB7U05_08925 [Mangrovibacterium sp.]
MSKLSTLIEQGLTPDLIDEVTDDLTYVGYLQRGDTTKCMIKRVEKTGTVTTIMYPNGYADFNYNWADRATITYAHRKN